MRRAPTFSRESANRIYRVTGSHLESFGASNFSWQGWVSGPEIFVFRVANLAASRAISPAAVARNVSGMP